MPEIILASHNAGKLQELEQLLVDLPCRIIPQPALGIAAVDETGLTFIENAILKARHACAESGRAALADDSGLIVDALGGAPGLYSARYAGSPANDEANIAKLLQALENVPPQQRTARLYSVIVLLRHANDPQPIIAEGHWEGAIATAPAGDYRFGYNPLFIDPALGITVAQMDVATRNQRSHRARALALLRHHLLHYCSQCDAFGDHRSQ